MKLVNSGVIIEQNGKRLPITSKKADEIIENLSLEEKKLFTDK